MKRVDRPENPGYGQVAVWHRDGWAYCLRWDQQWGMLLCSYQYQGWKECVRVRPGLDRGKRDMRRIVKPEQSGLPIPEAEGGEWLESYPNLVEFLTATRFTDPPGPRKPGSMYLSTRFKLWSLILKCHNEGIQLRCEGVTPEMALHAAETLLATPGSPWEPDPYWEAPKKKKGR